MERLSEAQKLESQQPFSLAQYPLFRVKLLHLSREFNLRTLNLIFQSFTPIASNKIANNSFFSNRLALFQQFGIAWIQW